MFYVMPNYLTVDSQSQVKPISWKEKFAISAKGSFDPYEYTVVGIVAGIRQAENSSPGFGQGMAGYAKRYGTAFADQVDGNIMVGGVYPTILKFDPRYFQLGRGSFVYRFGYAIGRIFIARTDSGGRMFNVPEFAGNATAIAISNVYYPAADRGFSPSLSDWGTQNGPRRLRERAKRILARYSSLFAEETGAPPAETAAEGTGLILPIWTLHLPDCAAGVDPNADSYNPTLGSWQEIIESTADKYGCGGEFEGDSIILPGGSAH